MKISHKNINISFHNFECTHLNFCFTFVVGVKIGATVGAAQVSVSDQGVGKSAVEASGLAEGHVHSLGKGRAAFVRAESRRILHAESAVHAADTRVVDPSHTEYK